MEAKIQGNVQEITFDIMEPIGYDAILGIPWFRERNPRIDYVTREICAVQDKYEIVETPEMSLPDYKTWITRYRS